MQTDSNKGGGPNEEVSKTQRSFDSELENLTDLNNQTYNTDYVELPEIDINKIVDLKQKEQLLSLKKINQIFIYTDSHWKKSVCNSPTIPP